MASINSSFQFSFLVLLSQTPFGTSLANRRRRRFQKNILDLRDLFLPFDIAGGWHFLLSAFYELRRRRSSRLQKRRECKPTTGRPKKEISLRRAVAAASASVSKSKTRNKTKLSCEP